MKFPTRISVQKFWSHDQMTGAVITVGLIATLEHLVACMKLMRAIGISGYLFEQRDLSFTPRKELHHFLASGPAPIYIMLPENSIKNIYHLALMIQDAILKNGYRALLSRECRRLGELLNSDNVLVTQSVPFGKLRALLIHILPWR